MIYDPTTYNPTTGARTPFPGNKISATLLATPSSQMALNYLSHFPTPNGYSSNEPGDYDNYAGSYDAGINDNNYTVRGDYNIGSHDFVYFRYLHDMGYRINNPNNLLAYNTSGVGVVLDPGLDEGDGPFHRVNTYQFHYVHTFSASSEQRIQHQLDAGLQLQQPAIADFRIRLILASQSLHELVLEHGRATRLRQEPVRR